MTWQRCPICSHPGRKGIEKKLKAGESQALIAPLYAVTEDHVNRHRAQHMHQGTELVVPAEKPVSVHSCMHPAALYEEHNTFKDECMKLVGFSISIGDTKGWALGLREYRGALDQQNKILGLYDQVDPRLQRAFSAQLIQVVATALEPFPDARQAVLKAIDEAEHGADE